MDPLRHFLALFLVVSLPSLFLYWLLVHPFVNFWRDRGIGFAYTTLLTILTAAMVALFSLRHFLLSMDYGTDPLLIGLGLVFLMVSGWMRFAIHKKLTMNTLLGLPEIAPDRFPRPLITDGIYARMRHPRYVQFLIALFGYALITNYLAVYLVTALWVPGIYLIVLLEEKELRDHFGNVYEAYCRKVPRFLPKLGRGHGSDHQTRKPRRDPRMTP